MPDSSLTVHTASVERCGAGLAFVRDKREFGRHVLDGCGVMWRKATGKVVLSRRLEWAFPRQKLVAALNLPIRVSEKVY